MVLVVDDVLALPGTIGKIIFQTLAQTVEKVAWVEYSRDLKRLLLRARHDYENGKITEAQFREVESYVFKEMRVARKIISGR